MNQLTVILILVLASTNASKYLQPLHQYQQEPLTRQTSDDSPYANEAYDEDRFAVFPKLTSDLNQLEGWASATDPRSFAFPDLQSNRLSKPDESRMKRKEASLSIVNALDVLRQQLMLEFARRKMNESKAQIQKNLEFLRKTGKRSHKDLDDPVSYGMQEFLLRKRIQGDDIGKALPILTSKSSEDKATTRRNESEPGYQT